jgi:CRISPR system Cascade subunit CasD
MMRFLCMRLYGPMAAWGDIAVGERRPASVQPSRSGVLGLVAAALGIQRTDSDRLAQLDAGVGFGSCLERHGELLVDYHTAQVSSSVDRNRALKQRATIPTRRVELAIKSGGNAIISQRTYYLDALASACLWTTSNPAEPSLDLIAKALREPVFVPYLGRKSCPLALPLDPQVLEAENPVEAMKKARFAVDSLIQVDTQPLAERRIFAWEGEWPGLAEQKTVQRRDKLHSRARWQFEERQEHLAQDAGDAHVPEST